jgi:uncharacterized protein YciI
MSAFARFAAIVLVLFTDVSGAAQAPSSSLFIVHFETGPSWNKSLEPGEQPGFAEHSANLSRLRKEGQIVFGARYAEYGVIFLEADSLESATKTIDDDPGVRSRLFVYRIAPLNVFYPWQD